MNYATDHPVRCAEPGCTASHPGSKWHAIQAHEQGWFTSADESSRCPEHVPLWVKEWRAQRAASR